MENAKFEYLQMLYKEALNQARCYVDSRYKILQFIGFYNGAVLTFGFSRDVFVLSTGHGSFGGLIISCLSLLVAIMGLATERSLLSYNTAYFHIIRKVEEILNADGLKEVGAFTYGADVVKKQFFHKVLPVNRAHQFFYSALIVFWTLFLVFKIVRAYSADSGH